MELFDRLVGYYLRKRAYSRNRRLMKWFHAEPLVSFSFDDFPASAYHQGSSILRKYGLHGTYFISMGLLGKQTPVGQIASLEETQRILDEGHELGCHTYDHLDACQTNRGLFENSIARNLTAIKNHFPTATIKSFSYPYYEPHPRNKKVSEKYFLFCRGGGQHINTHVLDLNLLRSVFIDKKSRADINYYKHLFQMNKELRGWLIFTTHDVSESPSDYGVQPHFLEQVINLSLESGARVLPIRDMEEHLAL